MRSGAGNHREQATHGLNRARGPRYNNPRYNKMRPKFLVGGAVIAAALVYMIYAGVTQSAVYFVTPSELGTAPVAGKAYRLGGMVERGSVHWEPKTLSLTFALSDGKASVPVHHRGAPPDLFGEGRGAVVEGSWTPDGYFRATHIMAKHSEEYKAPHDTSQAGIKELMRTLSSGSQ